MFTKQSPKILLQQLKNRNSTVDIVALDKTFLTKKPEKLVHIPGYQTVFNSRSDSKGGGTGLLIKDGIQYKCRKDLEVFIEKGAETLY